MAFYTWNPTDGTGFRRRQGDFSQVHPASLPPAKIKTGPYAGMPSARPASEYTIPDYDPSTQRLGDPTPDPSEGIPVIDLSADEIAEKAAAAADAAEIATERAKLYDNFQLVKEGAQGTLTRPTDAQIKLLFRLVKALMLTVYDPRDLRKPPPSEPTP